MEFKLGILAYGSLVDNPGEEISQLEIERIECETPFPVEFARISRTRGNAPTLIPYDKGRRVRAVIIVLNSTTDLQLAMNILYRRELHLTNSNKTYRSNKNPTSNTVVVKSIQGFMDIETVLFTSIGSNIENEITGERLAKYAIKSILTEAGEKGVDGIRYLQATKFNKIETVISEEYEKQILLITNSHTLEEAIVKLDEQRKLKSIV